MKERRTQVDRRAETERRVLDAATALIAERGPRALSLAEVGRLAGYSRGIVNHQFGSKQHLLVAVVLRAQQFDVPHTGGSGLDRLAVLVQTHLTSLRDRAPNGRAFLRLWTDSLGSDSTLEPIFLLRDKWFRDILASHIRTGIDDGSVRPDCNPDVVALALLGTVRGIGLQLVNSAEDVSVDLIAQQVADLVTHGLATETK
ncbi:TetR/AcrR family transcriptional regulator [Rhodococcus sp. G-MC3]|uniref:TetR/AcrR family transcriptional regulator n=1 Tax=Rhodococcus sp. G-MC3 TaxID=3046209 RepID=UPI0024B8EE91|nr:TetR/AcrR family transcriptional regulator [Rhodococcus sp. G-MC3]MDJ0394047.1 TetR/AcrR family transcriptional regulator [Rhodococcus sp. G-MC3]